MRSNSGEVNSSRRPQQLEILTCLLAANSGAATGESIQPCTTTRPSVIRRRASWSQRRQYHICLCYLHNSLHNFPFLFDFFLGRIVALKLDSSIPPKHRQSATLPETKAQPIQQNKRCRRPATSSGPRGPSSAPANSSLARGQHSARMPASGSRARQPPKAPPRSPFSRGCGTAQSASRPFTFGMQDNPYTAD